MPGSHNYQMVPSEENSAVATVEVPVEAPVANENSNQVNSESEIDLPPPYGEVSTHVSLPEIADDQPPLYTDVVKLPTYNESENISDDTVDEELNDHNTSIFLYWLRNNPEEFQYVDQDALGSDVNFIFFFLLSFIFNWVGFFFAYCFTNSYSAHYGAITGFGLSLVKWAFIVKEGKYLDVNHWVLYAFVLLGWVIFLRGIFSYVQLKRYVYSNQRQHVANDDDDDYTG